MSLQQVLMFLGESRLSSTLSLFSERLELLQDELPIGGTDGLLGEVSEDEPQFVSSEFIGPGHQRVYLGAYVGALCHRSADQALPRPPLQSRRIDCPRRTAALPTCRFAPWE